MMMMELRGGYLEVPTYVIAAAAAAAAAAVVWCLVVVVDHDWYRNWP